MYMLALCLSTVKLILYQNYRYRIFHTDMAKGGKKSGKKKGGKKKSSKLANMTEEERIAYEEQKALAEEELRKKKENMLTQFLKVKTTKLQHTK